MRWMILMVTVVAAAWGQEGGALRIARPVAAGAEATLPEIKRTLCARIIRTLVYQSLTSEAALVKAVPEVPYQVSFHLDYAQDFVISAYPGPDELRLVATDIYYLGPGPEGTGDFIIISRLRDGRRVLHERYAPEQGFALKAIVENEILASKPAESVLAAQ